MNTNAIADALYPAHLSEIAMRIARVLAAESLDALVIHSGCPPLAFQDDQSYPFRTNPFFKWLVPLQDASDCVLILRPGTTPRLLFHRPADFWHKRRPLPDAPWCEHWQITAVNSLAEARMALPAAALRTGFVGEAAAHAQLESGACNPRELVLRLQEQRVRKTAYEKACLREASLLGVRAHDAARAAFLAGDSEYGIHQAFLAACQQREQDLPYQAIVALNANAATLHYQDLERSTAGRLSHSLLLDAGIAFRGYASDITRTYVREAGDFRLLVDQLDEVQQTLVSAASAGTDWRDLHLVAHRLIAELLADSGIIEMDPVDAVERGLSSVFLPHGLGHLLGLQVHDVGGRLPDPLGPLVPPPAGHGALRLTRVLEPDFVVTMEPGIYFNDVLLDQARQSPLGAHINWSRVDAFRPYGGIRIEDNLIIGTSGPENLTRDAFARQAAQVSNGS